MELTEVTQCVARSKTEENELRDKVCLLVLYFAFISFAFALPFTPPLLEVPVV